MDEDKKLYPNCDATVWLRSCKEEIAQPLEGKLFGSVPRWLNGELIRNGPGSLEVGNYKFKHLFDSSALLHRFGIGDGKVTYQCRFLRSEVYKSNREAKRILFTEFGTSAVPDPCHTIFQNISAAFNTIGRMSDNAMISVYPFGDELYAFTEYPVIHKVNRKTLETEKKVNVSHHVAVVNHSSHPHVMKDGTVYNLGMSVGTLGPNFNIVCFPKPEDCNGNSMFEEAKIVATIPARWPLHPSYMHTFGITDNYFIIVEQPLSLSIPSFLKNKFFNQPMIGSFQWYEDEMTQINIISRKTGLLQYKFQAKAFFYLHLINQYETSDHIVLDVCSYKDAAMLDCMYIEAMENMQKNASYAEMFRSFPIRFVLPLTQTSEEYQNLVTLPNTEAEAYHLPDGNIFVTPESLCPLGCETPRINYEKYLGKKYQYFYAISADVDAENPGTIIKVDTINKTQLTWCETNCFPSEPIFVPRPNSEAEDDGIVLSAMVWGGNETNRVGLIILDAKTFEEVARAEFVTGGPVPKCLHGWFLSDEN